MFKPPKRLSRRTFLRGAGGVALGLPMLDAMRPRAARGATAAASPRRIMFVFQANGDQISRRFTQVGETTFAFDEFLAPLQPYRNDLLILNNLDKRFSKLPSGQVADNHEQGGSSLAPWPSGTGSYPIGGSNGLTIGFVQGPSADRAIGDAILAKNPTLPYRHLVYRVGGNHNDIWNLHSHAGPVGTQSPIPPETDPYAAYARIFTSFPGTNDAAAAAAVAKKLAKKQSALDLVLAEATALESKVGAGDKMKLDLHMTSVRDIERTLQTGGGATMVGASCAPFDLGTKIDVFNDDNHVVMGQLFFKISALAFACDLTRTIQFNWSGNTSDRVYKNLGMTDGHHTMSHVSTDDSFAKIRQIHKHLWTQNTTLYDLLKATPDGDGTLWDNTLVVHWNELAQGDTHAINNCMVIFAGVAQSFFRRGRMVDFQNKASYSDMLLSCFQYMGLTDVTSFGDARLAATGMPLAGLT
ncbi:MAG TPA: DUF1552 domain-containing protein [Polyangia bacterium]|nr:DUF1552 domain-containing protein [Polyangia bacterium]